MISSRFSRIFQGPSRENALQNRTEVITFRRENCKTGLFYSIAIIALMIWGKRHLNSLRPFGIISYFEVHETHTQLSAEIFGGRHGWNERGR